MSDNIPSSHEQLLARLNGETGRLGWSELVRHFARGVVIRVNAELDLVEVAAAVAQDRSDDIEEWNRAGQLRRASDNDAREWNETDPIFWAVVVAPWVLVQEVSDGQNDDGNNGMA